MCLTEVLVWTLYITFSLFLKKGNLKYVFIPVSIKAILFYSGMYRYSNNYPVVRVEISGYIVSIDSREKLTTYGGKSILMVIKLKIILDIFFVCIEENFNWVSKGIPNYFFFSFILPCDWSKNSPHPFNQLDSKVSQSQPLILVTHFFPSSMQLTCFYF